MSDSINIETVQETVDKAIENIIANENVIDFIDAQSTVEDNTQDPREKGVRLIFSWVPYAQWSIKRRIMASWCSTSYFKGVAQRR